MKTLDYILNIEKDNPKEFSEPINFIPDPPDELNKTANAYYYKICQLLLDRGRLSPAFRLYAAKLAEQVDVMHSLDKRPDNRQVNEYLRVKSTLCYEIGVTQEQLQTTGIPILY